MADQLSFDPPGRLFFGDNLEVMRRHIADESVDLVYLDPPFKSNRSYNLLFEHRDGRKAAGQVKAFDDTWSWSMESARAYDDVVSQGGPVSKTVRAFRDILSTTDMLAYLTMMAPRLVEMRRVLKPSGSLYLHCDPTADHYLKVLLDAVFGPTNFRNDVVWKRKAGRGETNRAAVRFGVSNDNLLVYAKSPAALFTRQYRPSNAAYIASKFTHVEPETERRYRLDNLTSPSFRPNLIYEYEGYPPPKNGWAVSLERMKEMHAANRLYFPKDKTHRIQRKRYLDELPGETVDSLWDDIPPINSQAAERLGYPTQKPLALLERIISASTEEGDVVLDPFCGCGTAIDAAQRMQRKWIGVDITEVAIRVIRDRLRVQHGELDYVLTGEPGTRDEAVALAELDKFEFQAWACRRAGVPNPSKKKGADRGIDGRLVGVYENGESWEAIVQAKGGRATVRDVRDLHGTVKREGASFGVLVTLDLPTKAMQRDAADIGFTPEGVPALQLLSVDDLFAGVMPSSPPPTARRKAEPPAAARRLRRVV